MVDGLTVVWIGDITKSNGVGGAGIVTIVFSNPPKIPCPFIDCLNRHCKYSCRLIFASPRDCFSATGNMGIGH